MELPCNVCGRRRILLGDFSTVLYNIVSSILSNIVTVARLIKYFRKLPSTFKPKIYCCIGYLENDKNLKHDSWRLEQLNRSTVDPSHPFRKFCTGRWLDSRWSIKNTN